MMRGPMRSRQSGRGMGEGALVQLRVVVEGLALLVGR